MDKRDRWKRADSFDMWSIPHFLFGVLTAFLVPLGGQTISTALILTVLIAVLWEIYERLAKIRESIQNSLLDVILSVVAFTLTSYALVIYSYAPRENIQVIAIAILVLYIYTNLSGWLAYRRRSRDFAN